MRSIKLPLVMLFLGLILLVCSWYLSYPVSMDSVNDTVFNHVSILYWFSLPLVLTSIYLIALITRCDYMKWVMIIGVVMTIYSLSYFYYFLPGSDSQFFRGLSEYFIQTNDLNPYNLGHYYFEWPSFFLLGKIVPSLTGMGLIHFEFILYATIGFLFATALYVYFSRAFKKNGFVAVISFFIMMFYFLNYQSVPFSFAFAGLLLLFMIETRPIESRGKMLSVLILFASIVLSHAFVPIYFIVYQLAMYIFGRNNRNLRLFFLVAIIYLILEISRAPFGFAQNIRALLTASSEYAVKIEGTLALASIPLDEIAQIFSRGVVVATVLISSLGFLILLLKKKLRLLDRSIFLTGLFYSATGFVVYILGSRTLAVVSIPVSLGIAYLFESRFERYMKYIFLLLLILSISIPLHSSFYRGDVMFQTEEAYKAENFMLDNYNWTNPSFILANYRVKTYLESREIGIAYFSADPTTIKEVDTVIYTVGLGLHQLNSNYELEKTLSEERLNIVYNNGISVSMTRCWNFTWMLKG